MGKQGSYLPAVDGLRAVAVLAVVAYHAGLPITGGFVGVDVFFVISGFLITRILRDELQASGRISYSQFYARRIRRIYPALVTVLATTIALSALLGAQGQQRVLASALASLAMVGNFHFQAVTGGYFDAASEHMPLLHLWSLGVEEQFYLVWPLLLPLIVRRRTVLLVIAALSLGLAEWWLRSNPEAAFYQMPPRAWELAGGAWLALRPLPKVAPGWMGPSGLLLVALGILLPAPAGHFPGLGTLPAVMGAMLLIHAARDAAAPVNQMLTSRPFVYVGLISYSLYLWHWPLLAVHRATNLQTSAAIAASLCLVAAGLAALTYRYVEEPLRRGYAPLRTQAAAIVCVACLGAVSATTLASRQPQPGTEASLVIEHRYRPCTVPAGHVRPLSENCRPQDADVVLWGDSHASSWQPFAAEVGSVADFTMTACMPFSGWKPEKGQAKLHPSACGAHNEEAMDHIRRHGRTIVVNAFFRDKMHVLPYFAAAIDEVAPHSNRILLLMPTPYLRRDASACIRLKLDCGMRRADYEAYVEPIRREFHNLSQRHPSITVVEVADFFCDELECPVARYGYPLYMDSHHITTRAARHFASIHVATAQAGQEEANHDVSYTAYGN